ncbi:hypothetical protein [Cupriavidus cauae]|uniref:Uncharacterized protein n=1 Tax=Cupriavidus cauae TaxID=2608999 RepID=A0A5M8AP31_9BURK|nr:hypothetical protein [Cupriavidus cauae]KAA6124492.1 hypothetical protein F1599_11315 [Cupriavidus cauae]
MALDDWTSRDSQRITIRELLESVSEAKFALLDRRSGDEDERSALRFDMAVAHDDWERLLRALCASRQIVVRDAMSGVPIGAVPVESERWSRCLVTLDDANKFWRELGHDEDLFQDSAAHRDAMVTLEAERGEAMPEGLSTQEVAAVFDNVGGWQESHWKNNLGKCGKKGGGQWLLDARMSAGSRGKYAATWNPVRLAQLLLSKKRASMTQLKKLFGEQALLQSWDAEWKTFLQHDEYFNDPTWRSSMRSSKRGA